MYCRALRALETGGAAGVVLDRSLMSDVVFADKNLAAGNISPEGYATYAALRSHLLKLVSQGHGEGAACAGARVDCLHV